MKANELMISDWVLYNKIPQQILEISGIDDEVYLETDELVHQSEIQPIPLTPEIFEKNGFIKQGADGWEYIHPDDSTFSYISYRILYRTYYNNNLFIKKYKGSNTSATLQISYINFVHQLQHALRLCGIEKEIEL